MGGTCPCQGLQPAGRPVGCALPASRTVQPPPCTPAHPELRCTCSVIAISGATPPSGRSTCVPPPPAFCKPEHKSSGVCWRLHSTAAG